MRKPYFEPAAEFFDRSSVPKEIHLVARIWQESSRIKHLWRLTDSEISSLFSELAYPCNKVTARRTRDRSRLQKIGRSPHPGCVVSCGSSGW
jgi:hypothetical protein